MLFNSIDFLLFLPIVFVLYWFGGKSKKWQNLFLVISSYYFYGYWDWRFTILIFLTSIFSFASGLLISKYEKEKLKRNFFASVNIILNLSILAVFKYFNFFTENIVLFLNKIGFYIDNFTVSIILPVGISFYTFQALSYTIDVYNHKIESTKDFVGFLAYICFFPQLVAGPIERATNLLPQFQGKRFFNYRDAVDGMRQMLWGFFKKIVIADNCAFIVNTYWDNYQHLNGLTLLVIGILFSLQIYSDFSGYSDIAIGCAKLFGIKLKRNFNYPYFSKSIPEFWRRWHISLMTWFRDYLYIPLGGSRCGKWKTIKNVFIVWALSGLWHGANWTFVAWGLFHAIILSIYISLNINTKVNQYDVEKPIWSYIKNGIQILVTFFLTTIGWIIFRSNNISEAFSFITRMFTTYSFENNLECGKGIYYLFIGFVMLATEWVQRDKNHALQLNEKHLFKYQPMRWSIYIFIVLTIVFFQGNSQTFLYFQF